MTDNQKRAHDIASSLLPCIITLRQNEILHQARTEIDTYGEQRTITTKAIDTYQEYLKLYNTHMELLNRDFPEGQ